MKKIYSIIVVLMLALCMPALAFGAPGDGSGGGGGNGSGGGGGDGSGDGTGGGSEEPLVVESASIEDGAQINPDDSITLVFSKNVCEASVRDANMELASVMDAEDASVPTTVVLADDQVEPDKKNDMVITFDQPLQEGEYTLTAQAGITSKSGDTLAEDYVLHFNVAPQESPESESTDSSSASASEEPESSSAASEPSSAEPESSSSASEPSSSVDADSSSSDASQQGTSGIVTPLVICIVVIAVIVGIVLWVKKKK